MRKRFPTAVSGLLFAFVGLALAGCTANAGPPAASGLSALSPGAHFPSAPSRNVRRGLPPSTPQFPYAGLVKVGSLFYGTTQIGGTSGLGTAYKMTSTGAVTTIYSFQGGADGAGPIATLLNVGGTLYGLTPSGGPSSSGTIFKLTTAGVETVLYAFQGGTDGQKPLGSLVNVSGTLYGTTQYGGASNLGTVFKITTGGAYSQIYSFQGGASDGEYPVASLTRVGGNLYGTTLGGGASNYGTLFKITPSGVETMLHSFQGAGTDGIEPMAPLTRVGSMLYGTTYQGGAYGKGTYFRATTGGVENVSYSFQGGADGQYPEAGVTKYNGWFYGTTSTGGSAGFGTVYKVSGATENVLWSFQNTPDGYLPAANLLRVGGTFYSTTGGGGTTGYGTDFKITAGGNETVLHSF